MKLRKLVKGRLIGAGSTIALSLAGSAIRHYVRTRKSAHTKYRSDADAWVGDATDQARRWLRANKVPDRVRDVLADWIAEDKDKSVRVVDAKIKRQSRH